MCKQKTAYEMLISYWSSDVCSSDLRHRLLRFQHRFRDPAIAAIDAADRIVLRRIIESGGAFRAAALRAPFSLDHICLITLWNRIEILEKRRRLNRYPSDRRAPCPMARPLSKAARPDRSNRTAAALFRFRPAERRPHKRLVGKRVFRTFR